MAEDVPAGVGVGLRGIERRRRIERELALGLPSGRRHRGGKDGFGDTAPPFGVPLDPTETDRLSIRHAHYSGAWDMVQTVERYRELNDRFSER